MSKRTTTRPARRPVPTPASRNGNGHLAATTPLPLPPTARVPAGGAVQNGANGDRDKAGRFQKGNPGGPGNLMYREMARRRRALLDAVSAEDIQAVGRRLLADALAGDHVASRLLLEQVVGRAPEAASEDKADLHELGLCLAAPLTVEVILAALEGVPPARALDFLRAAAAAPRPGLDTALDKHRAASLTDLRAAILAARAGQT
jgi:hypothetical protein